MSLRQTWLRIKSLPYDSPLMDILRAEAEAAEQKQKSDELDDALTRYRKGASDA